MTTAAGPGQPLPPLPDDWSRGLAIVAHPDDLEYGVSSAVAQWTAAGKQIAYLLATRGEAGLDGVAPAQAGPLREAEERASARLVGVERVDFLDCADGMVEYGLALRRELTRAIRRHRPELLITLSFELAGPDGTLNQADHRAVGLAVLDAARDAGNRWVFPELLAEGLAPVRDLRGVLVAADPAPSHALALDQPALDRGIASLQAQRIYFENLAAGFEPATFLTEQAQAAGRRQHLPYALEFRFYHL
jgi:LmbE family N-acetylglucosaminyl deacetylase